MKQRNIRMSRITRDNMLSCKNILASEEVSLHCMYLSLLAFFAASSSSPKAIVSSSISKGTYKQYRIRKRSIHSSSSLERHACICSILNMCSVMRLGTRFEFREREREREGETQSSTHGIKSRRTLAARSRPRKR